MKKFAKMSLVATIAVAGTVASAQPLAEAIKNVDVSGTVVYRYDDRQNDDGSADLVRNRYKAAVSLKSKVTDDVAFNSRIIAGGGTGFQSYETTTDGDGNIGITLTQANFAYTGLANTTIILGKQAVATPFTKGIDSDGTEQTGTGLLAMTTMGPVTAAAGYFNQTNFTGSDNAIVAAVMGSFGPINAKLWYLDVDNQYNQYFVKASGKIGPVSAYAQYSDVDNDDETSANNDVNLLKVGVSAKMGMFNAGVAYAKTGEDGSGIRNLVAENSAIGYSVTLHDKVDSDAYFIDLGAQVMPKLHIGLNYDKSEQDNVSNVEHEEYHVQFTYAHAKNLSAYVRIGQGEENDVDYNRGRLQVEYKF